MRIADWTVSMDKNVYRKKILKKLQDTIILLDTHNTILKLTSVLVCLVFAYFLMILVWSPDLWFELYFDLFAFSPPPAPRTGELKKKKKKKKPSVLVSTADITFIKHTMRPSNIYLLKIALCKMLMSCYLLKITQWNPLISCYLLKIALWNMLLFSYLLKIALWNMLFFSYLLKIALWNMLLFSYLLKIALWNPLISCYLLKITLWNLLISCYITPT